MREAGRVRDEMDFFLSAGFGYGHLSGFDGWSWGG